jgi:CubicO group peptidase (beta-lactamase class C family)
MRLKNFILLAVLGFSIFELFAQDLAKKIDSIAKSYVQPYSGMAIMVMKSGELVYEGGLGYENLETRAPVTKNTRFNLGGLSRQLTAVAVTNLVQNEQLQLDEKIYDIIGFPEFSKNLTVYHLLSHTSGLPSYMNLVEIVRKTPVTNQEVLSLLNNYGKSDFEPGTRYRFSNSDYALLALVIEKKTGMRFDRYMHRRVLRPMGIRDQLVSQRRMNRIRNRAIGYIFRADEGFLPNDPGMNTTIHGEAGVYMSMAEYRILLNEMRTGGLLNEETRKLLFTPAKFISGNEIYPQVGLAWTMGQEKNVRFFYQSGPNNAFTNYVMIIPESDLTIVLLSNQAGLFQLLDKIVYPIANLYTEGAFRDRIR